MELRLIIALGGGGVAWMPELVEFKFGLQEIDAITLLSGILVQSPEVAWGVDLFKEKNQRAQK